MRNHHRICCSSSLADYSRVVAVLVWMYDTGQFCGKEDKEKFEMDAKGSGSGNESNFGMDANDNLLTQ
jgi:hypothetical protein